MNNIEEVKKIALLLSGRYGRSEEYHMPFARVIWEEICQLFEPKPDKSRLLKDKEIGKLIYIKDSDKLLPGLWLEFLKILKGVAKAQLDKDMEWEAKTASIKDREKKEALQVAHDAATFLARQEIVEEIEKQLVRDFNGRYYFWVTEDVWQEIKRGVE